MKPETAVTVLAILGATTAVAIALRGAIPALHAFAQHRRSKRMDDAITGFDHVLEALVQLCDVARRVIPRVVIGPLPSTQPLATIMPAKQESPQSVMAPMKPLSVPPPIGKEPKL